MKHILQKPFSGLLLATFSAALLLSACDHTEVEKLRAENEDLRAEIAKIPKWPSVTIKRDMITASGRAELAILTTQIESMRRTSSRNEAAMAGLEAAKKSPEMFFFTTNEMKAKIVKKYDDNSVLFYSEDHPYEFFVSTPKVIKSEEADSKGK